MKIKDLVIDETKLERDIENLVKRVWRTWNLKSVEQAIAVINWKFSGIIKKEHKKRRNKNGYSRKSL